MPPPRFWPTIWGFPPVLAEFTGPRFDVPLRSRQAPATMKDTIMANAEQALPRTFDLIVYGASGFTGRLVAEHLLGSHGATGEIKCRHRNGQEMPNFRGFLMVFRN
jgi:hypothetical protein